MLFSKFQPITDSTVRTELSSLLESLPPWRKERAISYRYEIDKYTCAKAYLLLKELLTEQYGINDDVEFVFGRYGKPFLKAYPKIHFNLSHCHKAIFCAVGDSPLGVDVEEIQFDKLILQTAFCEPEFQAVYNAENPPEEFTQLWTQKESYLKLIGKGLNDDIRNVLNNKSHLIDFKTEIHHDIGVVTTIANFNNQNANV